MKKRLLCFLLTAALTLGIFAGMTIPAQAATKQEKTRAIAIVFDNSGSMYQSHRTRWCQATYAMEVFAAMMNEGDQLLIYPMHGITLGRSGSLMTSLTINGPKDASKIREIYTPSAGGTPFSTVTKAYEGLIRTTADEKYLIVITDGAFDNGNMPISDVESKLDLYSQDVNLMFLGIEISDGENGSRDNMPNVHDSSRQFYKKVDNSSEVLSALTEMCNMIFGRDELKVNNNQITFDVSMSKLIIFVQGDGIEKLSLNGGIKTSEHATKYSTYGSDEGNTKDESLQGMLVTYTDLNADTYTISYTGSANDICVYYEPNVDLYIRLVDQNGQVHDTGDNLPEGSYRLEYGMLDMGDKNNPKPTDSDLLGKQNYTISYTLNGVTETIQSADPGSIELTLEAGDILDGEFTVQYLNDYTIHKNGDSIWGPGGLIVIPRALEGITLQVTGGADTYKLSALEEEAVYRLTVSYQGTPIVGDELQNTMVSVDLSGGNAITKLEKDNDGYTLYIRYNGDAPNTSTGDYVLTASITYSCYGISGTSNVETRAFTVVDDSTSLGAALVLSQDFYEIPKLDQSAPIYLNLTMGGAPMDSRTFAGTLVTVDIPGAAFDLQPDEANSRYIITLKDDGNLVTGKTTVTANVSGFDEIGRAVTTQATAKIELQNYPSWLPIVIYSLIALLLLLLIWLYLNAKILPKHISVGPCTFIVDGEIVAGAAKCSYTGKNKRRGTLSVQSPHYGANPAAKCGYTLELEAISPRRTRSSARSVQVVNVRPLSANSTIAVQIGGCNLSRDPVSGKLMKAGGKPGAPLSFKIGNKAKTSVTAEVMDMANGGGEVTVSMSVPLKFL